MAMLLPFGYLFTGHPKLGGYYINREYSLTKLLKEGNVI
jgi:hypothetical protein